MLFSIPQFRENKARFRDYAPDEPLDGEYIGVDFVLPCHAPLDIVFPSSLRHSTCGFGVPVAAQRSLRCVPSWTTIGRNASGVPAPAIVGGTSSSLENVSLTLIFQALMPGVPGVPLMPERPGFPRGPWRPAKMKYVDMA